MEISFRNCLLVTGLLFVLPATVSAKSADEHWQDFRQVFPYHHQAVAATATADDGTRTLIVSEPPPHVTLDGIKKCGLDLIVSAKVKRHPVGHDGWVEDVLICLKPTNKNAYREFVDRLHVYLYDSAFGAEVLALPAAAPRKVAKGALDLKVSTVELRKWLDEDKIGFRSVAGGPALTLADILAKRPGGVFRSATGGLVIWAFPRHADLGGYRRQARQFAVCSDLLVGAVGDKDTLVLVGRRRAVPTDVLPPLRAETLALLASVRNDHLAQSYERNRVFAGRYDGKWDWAPILLSPELIDTEYGGLLNITDQLLKGWSMNGLVEYERFKYPEPESYPFEKPLFQMIEGATSLTFNWNTAGAGYAVQDKGRTWFALNRTGSLPVTYIPVGASKAVREAATGYERTGYDFFAGTADPNLVRVVGYAAAYQIFRHYRPSEEAPREDTPAQTRGHEVLAGHALAAFRAVIDADDDKLDRVAEKGAEGAGDRVKVALRRRLRDLRAMLADYLAATDDDGLKALAKLVANPRRLDREELVKALGRLATPAKKATSFADILERFPDASMKATVTAYFLAASGELRLLSLLAEADSVRKDYVKAFERTGGWIRTPSVVISRATGEVADTTGGHNVDAKVPLFRPGAVEPGKIRVVEEGGRLVIEYHPADVGKVPALVRKAGALDATPGRTAASVQTALAGDIGDGKGPPPRGPAKALFDGPEPPDRTPWRSSGKPAAVPEAERKRIEESRPKDGPMWVIERSDGNEYKVSRWEDADTVTTVRFDSVLGLHEYLRTAREASPDKESPLHLTLRGFSAAEAEGIMTTFAFKSEVASTRDFLIRREHGTKASNLFFKDYDFKNAKLESTTVLTAGSKTTVTMDFVVPPREKGKPSLWVRIRAAFDSAVKGAEDFVASIKTKIGALFGKEVKSRSEFDSSLQPFLKDAKKYGLELEIKTSGGKDILDDIIDDLRVNGGRRDEREPRRHDQAS